MRRGINHLQYPHAPPLYIPVLKENNKFPEVIPPVAGRNTHYNRCQCQHCKKSTQEKQQTQNCRTPETTIIPYLQNKITRHYQQKFKRFLTVQHHQCRCKTGSSPPPGSLTHFSINYSPEKIGQQHNIDTVALNQRRHPDSVWVSGRKRHQKQTGSIAVTPQQTPDKKEWNYKQYPRNNRNNFS